MLISQRLTRRTRKLLPVLPVVAGAAVALAGLCVTTDSIGDGPAAVQFAAAMDQWGPVFPSRFKFRVQEEARFRKLGLYNVRFVPNFAAELTADDRGRRAAAAKGLGLLGPLAKAAVPALTGAVADSNVRVQEAAISALGEIGADDKTVIAAMIDAAAKRPELESAVVSAMCQIKPSDPTAIQFLIDSLSNAKSDARGTAAAALGHIGPPAKVALPLLRKATGDKDPAVRIAAWLAVWQIDADEDAVPKLTAMIDDKFGNPTTIPQITGAIMALAEIGAGAESALGRLEAIGEDSELYPVVLYARWRIAADDKSIPRLRQLLRSKNEAHKIRAAQMLARMGPAAKAAYDDLRAVCNDDANSWAQIAAFEAMVEIDKRAAWIDAADQQQ